MKRNLFIIFGIVVALIAVVTMFGTTIVSKGLWLSTRRTVDRPLQHMNIRIGKAVVKAEVADTDESRRKGLSGRLSLGELEGMVFVFKQPGPHAFWMQGMKFPLDIIWIRDGEVVDVALNVPVPEGDPLVLTPEAFATQVLEVNAGFVVRHNVLIGSKVTIEM